MLSNASKLILILIFTFTTSLFSQESTTKYKILGIEVEGARSADASTIIALTGLKEGETISYPYDENLNVSLKALWDRRQFSNVDVLVDKVVGDGVFLTIVVEENKRLSAIKVFNNNELTSEEIKKAVGKNKGDIVTEYDLYLIKKDIKDLYDKEGLTFAKVFPEILQSDSSDVYIDLKIYVEEGSEFYVESINFNGNSEYSNSDLASVFDETHTKSWYEFWSSSKFDKKDYKKDKELISKFYANEGFMDYEFLSDSVEYDEDNQAVHITVNIKEGKRYYVRNITFEGNTVFPDEALVARLDFPKGEVYNKEKFIMNLNGNQEFSDALSLYNNTGYLQTRFAPQEVKVAADSVDIVISTLEGDRYKIRKVIISGNTKTKDKVIRRTLYTRPGDYFNRAAIVRSVKELGVMGYFNPEKLRPDVKQVDNDNTSVDLIYNVEERSTDTFNASIGFAGSFGLTGSVGLTFNNFSILEPLNGGAGQVFNFNWEFGQSNRYRNFSLGFTEPWLFDEPTTVGFNVFDIYYNFSTLKLQRQGFRINIGRRVKWPDDYFRIDGSFQFQLNDISQQSGVNSQFYRPGKYNEITVGGSISRNNTNELFFPSQGSKFRFTNNWALGAVGIGQTDFFKSEIYFDFYNTLYKLEEQDRVVLYLGAQMGYIDGIKNDTTIAPIELYRMGGAGLSNFGTIPFRGYGDGDLENIGGKLHAKFTAEMRFAITLNPMPIYFYSFAMAGNVWDGFGGADLFDLKRSAGVGLKMLLNPIGIIGFSYGYGFDPTTQFGNVPGWKFLFEIGQ
ncbi:MAG: outer membrane protein assembly factor BamA [Ignavibacteriae bacterium HGW-Ignavibacteriae-4]|jgi:outer membrane protein insertion porin family|nr:MAG: outer membrane protein assembly factor BamA [Ignavibacteriae bacterium HGW-Ignavibacteriae-4]